MLKKPFSVGLEKVKKHPAEERQQSAFLYSEKYEDSNNHKKKNYETS